MHCVVLEHTIPAVEWGKGKDSTCRRPPGKLHRRLHNLLELYLKSGETAVAQWLRCCATNRKVAGSIPASVSGFFIDTKSFRSHYGPMVESASNRNEYQEYFLGVKAAGA